MSTTRRKCRRTGEQASPRGARKSRIQELFRPGSPTSSSSSDSPSSPRRRHGFRKLVKEVVRPRRAIAPEIDDPEYMPGGPESAKDYVGVRYRVELNKYVTEIRPTKSTKKIWLGTYGTAEEAARAFDIGNLCCKKNLPLNFADSPRLLRRISSRLSLDKAHNAIAKLAKEVARVVINVGSDGAAAKKEHHLVQQKTPNIDPPAGLLHQQEHEHAKSEPRTHRAEMDGAAAVTYTEEASETHHVVAVMEELDMPLNSGGEHSVRKLNTEHHVVAAKEELDMVATSMPMNVDGEGGSGGHGWSFDVTQLTQLFFDDERADIPIHKLINFGPDQQQHKLYGEVL